MSIILLLGCGYIGTVVLAMARVAGIIDWPVLWVFAPLLIALLIFALMLVCVIALPRRKTR